MPKIKQFTTILICKCVGRPAAANKDGRITCRRTIQIPMSDIGPTALTSGLIKKETQPFLDKAGWKKLKTLGHFQRLCPSCTKYVLGMRQQDKEMWG